MSRQQITMEIAREIRRQAANGIKPARITSAYQLYTSHINKIIAGSIWKEAV